VTLTSSTTGGKLSPSYRAINQSAPCSLGWKPFWLPSPSATWWTQRENRLDFGSIMDTGKIVLAKLPHGQMGKENAFLLGSLIVAKFQQLAMARQAQRAESRRPFYLYIDEFQNFITPSMAEILSGARKYGLGLILAHQELHHLDRDRDVASAVLSNPYTRIVFRVGDADARKLADGFSFFEAADLQNLETGQAICRVEKANGDFNLFVPNATSRAGAAERREEVVAASRAQYAQPRSTLEASMQRAAEHSPLTDLYENDPASQPHSPVERSSPSRSPDSLREQGAKNKDLGDSSSKNEETSSVSQDTKTRGVPRSTRDVADLGRGGEQHRAIQQRIKEAAEAEGFRAIIEKEILNGGSHIDVVLERGGVAWACQVGVTNTIDHEVGQVRNCVKAGYERIVVIGTKPTALRKMEAAVRTTLGEDVAKRMTYFLPDVFISQLSTLVQETIPTQATHTSHGWVVTTETVKLSKEETKMREEKALRALATHMIKRPKEK